eukprot:8311494-Ditylum_brightwellii.AAC.1
MDKANEHLIPDLTTTNLTKDSEGPARKESWDYRSMIGMLNFVVNLTMLELAQAVHQCARLCSDPKASHETAVKHIVRYLLITREKNGVQPAYGLNMRADMTRGQEVYVDASVTGDWERSWSDDPKSVLSRT